MPLTDIAVRAAKPGEKPIRLFDSHGLYLEISPKGGKWWRFKYRFGQRGSHKEKRLSLGVYPDVGLKEARERRDEMRRLLANGIDPGVHRKARAHQEADRAANKFEVIAREWLSNHAPIRSEINTKKVVRLFERDIFPWLGVRPIEEITPPELLETLKKIERRGAKETAHRALGHCRAVFAYAIATSRLERNPAVDLRGALQKVKGGNFAAITDPERLGVLLRAIDDYKGTLIVCSALRLAPLVFVPPGELAKAKWSEIDFEAAEWRYLVTKTNTLHIVPLARQAIDILQELHPLTGGGQFVFPSARGLSRHMTTAAMTMALKDAGYDGKTMTVHGFRAMARTNLDEVLGFPQHVIEQQLAHAVKDPNGRAYNRTAHLPQRREMMQRWADYLDGLKNGDV